MEHSTEYEDWQDDLHSAKYGWMKAVGVCDGYEDAMSRVSELAQRAFMGGNDDLARTLRDMVLSNLRQGLALARNRRDEAQAKVAKVEKERPQDPEHNER